jgi:NADPH:quinone reductase-like Zn-dependent oxidoreductase
MLAAMRAIVHTEYGPPEVLRPAELPTPVAGSGELRVAVRAAGIGFGDLMARDFGHVGPRRFTMPLPFWLPARLSFGWRRPKRTVLGAQFAGVVAEVGTGVTRFAPGDAVFGYLGPRFGACAEYLTIAETGLVAPMPANVDFDEAASLPYGAMTALNLLRRVGAGPGRRVLVLGAAGGIGVHAVQIARHLGAEVGGVCGPAGVNVVRLLGADPVVDYTRDELTAAGGGWDVVFDIPGRASCARVRPVLTPRGTYLRASFRTTHLVQMLATSVAGGRRIICALSMEKLADLFEVRELVEAGAIRPIIDRRFSLEQAADAHRYLEAGHRRGGVVLTVAAPDHDTGAGMERVRRPPLPN